MDALGLIEVRGFLGAVSVADAALKAANVSLRNAEVIRGGLTTVELTGDVAAVNAAVDAGTVIAEQLNCLISHHVIARVDRQTEVVISKKPTEPQPEPEEEPVEEVIEEIVVEPSSEPATIEAAPVVETTPTAEATVKEAKREELQKQKVVDLRKLAYQKNIATLKKGEIKFANKKTLVEAILADMERSESDWN